MVNYVIMTGYALPFVMHKRNYRGTWMKTMRLYIVGFVQLSILDTKKLKYENIRINKNNSVRSFCKCVDLSRDIKKTF